MSRYEKNLGDETLSVGWDKPMNTFFAQVSVNQSAEDWRDLPLRLWLGSIPDEFTDFDDFESNLREKGYEIQPTLKTRLRREQSRSTEEDEKISLTGGWTLTR